MITSSSVYGLKMQWTPEHAQWAEQHFDISSTTRSPAHKAEAYRGHLQRTYQYAWANDDISALTASNLLKKYAEKYSGILEGPSERSLLCSYTDGPAPAGLLNGRKSESDWQDGIYPMSCAADVIAASKAGVTVEVSASVGNSTGSGTGSLVEPGYSSSNCGGHTPAQDFSSSYNGSYLHSSYSGQSTPGLPSPHPSPLHSAGLLQPPPPPPPPPPPTLVPSYNAGSPNLSSYSYPTAGYPPQTPVAGYSPGGGPPPPPSAYLPSGIAAPTPLTPSTLPGYTYQSHSHAPIAPTPLNGSSANSLKRKAFYMTGQGDMDSAYGNFSYSQQQQQPQQRSTQSPMYRMPDSSIADSSRGNGFDRNAEASSLAFKPTKQSMSSDQQRKFSGQSAGSRALTPPSSYGSGKSFSGKFSEEHRQHLGHSGGASSAHPAAEQLKNSDASLVELITTEVLQQGMPPVDWSDIAGLDLAKATLKDEVLWPLLRPDMFSGLGALPRTVLLFGPQGSGRTLLARCVASQMGAAFLQLSGQALATKWVSEGDKIVQASFLVARCRQPAVVFISEVELLLSGQLAEESPVQRLRSELLLQLDGLLSAAADEQVLVICSTSKPEEIDEPLRRYFMKRLLVPLPDAGARHQIISQLLAQHNYCLNDKEVALLVQRTEGFSGLDVARLCQEAVIGPLHGMAGSDFLPSQVRPVSYQDFENVICKIQPSISQKELDTYTEWNKMFGCCQ
ncbi:fidgetin isoform X1 [Clupea harengus]|uniref:Fidgetin n=2 Tax=Clupea harengus TaxID=7950 RepID=A0A6P8EQK3_CLUHA|nr:fidgetin isoform X1 [Clupea harengus]XP_031414204.1 fidgetin isoform X1 [Clupea harengus]